MISSLVLTALTPTSDTDPLNVDCTKRNPVFSPSGITTCPAVGTRSGPSSTSTTSTSSNASDGDDAYDAPIHIDGTRTHHALVACQWTGTPIRAIVPLPRRKLGANGAQDAVLGSRSVGHSHTHLDVVHPSAVLGPSPCRTRSARVWDDADTDSDAENEDDDDDEDGDEENGDGSCGAASRCLSYESITAAEGLSAWSFEELRVECYAQSLVARGTRPPPAIQPGLAIPPAFIPRSVLRGQEVDVHSQQ